MPTVLGAAGTETVEFTGMLSEDFGSPIFLVMLNGIESNTLRNSGTRNKFCRDEFM